MIQEKNSMVQLLPKVHTHGDGELLIVDWEDVQDLHVDLDMDRGVGLGRLQLLIIPRQTPAQHTLRLQWLWNIQFESLNRDNSFHVTWSLGLNKLWEKFPKLHLSPIKMLLISIFTWRVCILCYYGLREHCIQDDTPERAHRDHHPDTWHSVFGADDKTADRSENKFRPEQSWGTTLMLPSTPIFILSLICNSPLDLKTLEVFSTDNFSFCNSRLDLETPLASAKSQGTI